MHTALLQYGILCFVFGLVLAALLVPNNVFKVPAFTRVFTNGAKLKSAHLDFFMQTFMLGLVYLIEYALRVSLPKYVIVPMIFGAFGNPILFLWESTPFIQHPVGSKLFPPFMLLSTGSLLFAWAALICILLPFELKVVFGFAVALFALVCIAYSKKAAKRA